VQTEPKEAITLRVCSV